MTEIWRCNYCGKEIRHDPWSKTDWHVIGDQFDAIQPSGWIHNTVSHFCVDCYSFYNIGFELGRKEWAKARGSQ